MPRLLLGLLLAVMSVFGFASTFIFGASLTKGSSVSPMVLSFMRFAIAGGVMAVIALVNPRERARLSALDRKDLVKMSYLGPIGTSLMAMFVFMGCARVSAANASMADALTPLMIYAVSAFHLRRVDAYGLVSLACGLLGAVLVIGILNGSGLALDAYSVGDVYIMLSAATWGFYTVYGRECIVRCGSTAFTCITMLFGAVAIGCCLPFCSLIWPSDCWTWLQVLGLGLISTLMPFWTWNAAQKYLSVSFLGVSAYFTPVFAMVMAGVFLGETTTGLQWLGSVFVILSGIIEYFNGRRKC